MVIEVFDIVEFLFIFIFFDIMECEEIFFSDLRYVILVGFSVVKMYVILVLRDVLDFLDFS